MISYQIEENLKAEEKGYLINFTFLKTLTEFKNDKSIEFLINLLKNNKSNKNKNSQKFINYWITELLTDFGSQAVPSLNNLLFDPNIEIRLLVTRIFGKINDTKAIGALSQVLCNDTSGRVKYNASAALAKIGFPAVNTLLQVIQDQNPVVRKLGADTLGEIGDRRALQPLTHLLSDIDHEVQKEANKAIEKICKTHNLNPQQFIRQSQSKNKGITEIKNNHSSQINDPVQCLKKVKELLDMGAITQEGYKRKKSNY